jgi:eukaryotic-like serine/threonine-protein kinase
VFDFWAGGAVTSEASNNGNEVRQTGRPGRRPGPIGRRRAAKIETFDLDIGERLDEEYVITERVSAGPITEIYGVWSSSRLCAFAAKVLRTHLRGATPEERVFAREGHVLRRLSHPNVVRVYEANRRFIVMDRLTGPSLLERISAQPRRRMPISDALKIAVQLGSALEHVHSRGLIYRDMKPSNVIFRSETPILIDFGSCIRYRPGVAVRDRLGTDPYMAPEQCLGDPLSPASDLFGLGAVLFEMISGEWPFEDRLMNVFDRTRLENRFPQVRYAPGQIRRKVPAVSPDLEAIVNRCLARDPADRFASAGEAVVALDRLLRDAERLVPSVVDIDDLDGTSGRAA